MDGVDAASNSAMGIKNCSCRAKRIKPSRSDLWRQIGEQSSEGVGTRYGGLVHVPVTDTSLRPVTPAPPVPALVHSGAVDVTGPRISVHPVLEVPLPQVEQPELQFGTRVAKCVVDRLLALVGLLVLSPLLVAIALVIRVSSRGPVMFRQVRIGLGGRHFTLWKFRTMVRDAESRLPSLMHLNEQDGVLFKIRNDPRVTGVGRVLRRWSLDELPQLWNVLRGDMSLVGPRPPIPSEVARYDERVHRRLLVKPGMTGLWQVSGRAELPWDDAVRLDLHYVEHWSLGMDAAILGRTCMAVVRQRGAY